MKLSSIHWSTSPASIAMKDIHWPYRIASTAYFAPHPTPHQPRLILPQLSRHSSPRHPHLMPNTIHRLRHRAFCRRNSSTTNATPPLWNNFGQAGTTTDGGRHVHVDDMNNDRYVPGVSGHVGIHVMPVELYRTAEVGANQEQGMEFGLVRQDFEQALDKAANNSNEGDQDGGAGGGGKRKEERRDGDGRQENPCDRDMRGTEEGDQGAEENMDSSGGDDDQYDGDDEKDSGGRDNGRDSQAGSESSEQDESESESEEISTESRGTRVNDPTLASRTSFGTGASPVAPGFDLHGDRYRFDSSSFLGSTPTTGFPIFRGNPSYRGCTTLGDPMQEASASIPSCTLNPVPNPTIAFYPTPSLILGAAVPSSLITASSLSDMSTPAIVHSYPTTYPECFTYFSALSDRVETYFRRLRLLILQKDILRRQEHYIPLPFTTLSLISHPSMTQLQMNPTLAPWGLDLSQAAEALPDALPEIETTATVLTMPDNPLFDSLQGVWIESLAWIHRLSEAYLAEPDSFPTMFPEKGSHPALELERILYHRPPPSPRSPFSRTTLPERLDSEEILLQFMSSWLMTIRTMLGVIGNHVQLFRENLIRVEKDQFRSQLWHHWRIHFPERVQRSTLEELGKEMDRLVEQHFEYRWIQQGQEDQQEMKEKEWMEQQEELFGQKKPKKQQKQRCEQRKERRQSQETQLASSSTTRVPTAIMHTMTATQLSEGEHQGADKNTVCLSKNERGTSQVSEGRGRGGETASVWRGRTRKHSQLEDQRILEAREAEADRLLRERQRIQRMERARQRQLEQQEQHQPEEAGGDTKMKHV